MKLEPFVHAFSEASGMCSTVYKAGCSLVQIGGSRYCSSLSIAGDIGATVSTEERKFSCTLGRMYYPDSPFYRVNTVSLTDKRREDEKDARIVSDGKKMAKLVYWSRQYSTAFQELSEQVQDYPLTIDISRSDEIDVVRSNIMLVKHLVGIAAALVAAAWFGFESVLSGKDVETSAYILAVYALWVNLGYVPVLGRDTFPFSDILRVKRRRVIEALLHNKRCIGNDRTVNRWNYRQPDGSAAIVYLDNEEAALTARMCQFNTFVIALDSCSMRSYRAEGAFIGPEESPGNRHLKLKAWTVAREHVNLSGTSPKIG